MAVSPEILFEDASILVVNKMPGIAVIPERVSTGKLSLQSMLEKQFGKLYVVHRIDRDTSGVICFARTEAAHRHLSKQFENRETRKFYSAIVEGRLEGQAGEISAPVLENPARLGTMMVHPRGKEALTLFEVQEQFQHAALLRVEIKTGRTHQIRIHFASCGHPLLVDPIYGKDAFFLSSIKKKYKQTEEAERPTLARLSLHAALLEFKHPQTGESLHLEAALPKDLETALKILRKYDS
ncbi:MAG: RluA family pseudouridine synthase [Chitinophagales bacterium]